MESKSPIEILAYVIGCSPGFVQRYIDNGKGNVSVTDALEAIKLFGKQAFVNGFIKGLTYMYPNITDKEITQYADEYINKLEEQA